VHYRGNSLDLEITPKTLKVAALRCAAESVKVGLKDRTYELRALETMELPLS
jgi:hypothetical protein